MGIIKLISVTIKIISPTSRMNFLGGSSLTDLNGPQSGKTSLTIPEPTGGESMHSPGEPLNHLEIMGEAPGGAEDSDISDVEPVA